MTPPAGGAVKGWPLSQRSKTAAFIFKNCFFPRFLKEWKEAYKKGAVAYEF